MAGELIWARSALDDIEAIARFIARDSQVQARATVEHLMEEAAALLDQTQSPIPSSSSSKHQVKERSQGRFRILYECHGEDVHLLAVTGCR